MASSNSFAALADNDDEVPNQASKKPQAVPGAIPHVSASGQKGQGKDRQPVISDRVISRHPGGDKPAHSGAGPRRADRQSGARAVADVLNMNPVWILTLRQAVAPRELAAPRATLSR
jgi:hypothetical protein